MFWASEMAEARIAHFFSYPYVFSTLHPSSLLYFLIMSFHNITRYTYWLLCALPHYSLFTATSPMLEQFLAEWVLPLQNC